jgi:hypothetical protein
MSDPIGRQEARRLLRKHGIDPDKKREWTRWLARRQRERVKREIAQVLEAEKRKDAGA